MCENPYPDVGREQFLAKITPLITPAELEQIETAYIFSKYGHRAQYRDGGSIRYFEHPKAVAWMLVNELKVTDWRVIVMALLHDIKEDSYILSWQRVQLNFGRRVTIGLKLLTKEPKDGYLERLKEFGTWRELLVKICDRLHNLRTLTSCTAEKRARQISESRKEYVPLCDLLIERLPPKARWRGEALKSAIIDACDQEEAALRLVAAKP